MTRSVLAFLFLTPFLVASSLFSQSSEYMPVGSVAEMIDLSTQKISIHPACGKYFQFSGVSKEPGKFGILFLIAKDSKGDTLILPWASDKFGIRIVAGQEVPRLKILRSGGPIYPWAEISLSKEDYDRAPCLVHVQTLR